MGEPIPPSGRALMWGRGSITYQFHGRSFTESGGEGDLDGVTARLKHISGPGVLGI